MIKLCYLLLNRRLLRKFPPKTCTGQLHIGGNVVSNDKERRPVDNGQRDQLNKFSLAVNLRSAFFSPTQNGYASYLDELDAQRTLFSTQLNLVTVKNNLLLAQIDLYRALGGGWQNNSKNP